MGAAKMAVLAIWIAPCPLPPAFVANNPGLTDASGTVTAALVPTLLDTVMLACVEDSVSHGKKKLICSGETEYSGAGIPLTRTFTPPSAVGSGKLCAAPVAEARFVPNSDPIRPPALACPGAKLAPLTIPLAGKAGGVVKDP